MSDVLTPEQIAALVAAAQEGGEPERKSSEPRLRRSRRVREIDFSRPNKFPQEQQRRLERAHEVFCRTASSRLSAELLTPIELEVLAVDQLTWSSASAQIPASSICAVVAGEPIGTQLLMTAELPLVLRLLERLLGGTGTSKPVMRELTEIEISLVRRFFGTLLAQLSSTWEELAGVSLGLSDIESQIANVNLAPPSEPTLMLTIEAKIGASSSTISLLLPHRSIEPIAAQLSAGQYGEMGVDEGAAAAVRAGVATVDVELRAEVAATELTLDEVLQLGPGSVLRFGVPASAGVTLFTGQVPAYRGQPGRNGNRRTVQVLERLEDNR
jgi:flagellar motor switch protein FliM